jgi:hypothetical protein
MKNKKHALVFKIIIPIPAVNQVPSLRDCAARASCSYRRLKSAVNQVSSLRDCAAHASCCYRRLKSTVNQVSSLRDYAARVARYDAILYIMSKSRRDDTLLTVDFSLRRQRATVPLTSNTFTL